MLHFSGLGQNDLEYIDISMETEPRKSSLLEALSRAGFGWKVSGTYRLLPCPLGTYLNPSASHRSDLKCVECPAG